MSPLPAADQGHLTHRDRHSPLVVVTEAPYDDRRAVRRRLSRRSVTRSSSCQPSSIEGISWSLPSCHSPRLRPVGKVVDGDHDVGPETLVGERLDRDQPDLVRGRLDALPLARQQQPEAVDLVAVRLEGHRHEAIVTRRASGTARTAPAGTIPAPTTAGE